MWTLCNACREKKKISKRGCYGDVQLRGFCHLLRVAHGWWDKRNSRGTLCNDESDNFLFNFKFDLKS